MQVIYKIETIFVMDEKPFELQRAKKFSRVAAKDAGAANSPSQHNSSNEKSGDRPATDTVAGLASSLAAVDEDSKLALEIKSRTNSSVLQTTSLAIGKSSKEKPPRKRSSDQKRSF